MKFLIGCDPEVFVRDAVTGLLVSAHGLVAGTKKKPLKVERGAVQVDGMALEINITPAATREEFVRNVRSVYDTLAVMVPRHKLVVQPVAVFDEAYFKSCPDSCKELGCDPDYDAYTGNANERPATTEPFRTGAGHMHFSWTTGADIHDPSHIEDCKDVARQMDWYIGMWTLTYDKDNKRRSLYGKAGCFRPKHYGCEYRTPSNAWLATDDLIGWVFDAGLKGLAALDKGKRPDDDNPGLAQRVIDGNDTNWGKKYGYYQTGQAMPPGGYWGPEKKAA